MTVRVATVLSAREWEPGLVAHARENGSVRIVVRAYRPSDIDSRLDDIDVVVAGGDVSWVTPGHIERWKAGGSAVVGVVPAGDGPAERLLHTGGADEIVPDSIAIDALVQAIRFAAPSATHVTSSNAGRMIAVTGARGGPGTTEVAVGLAMVRSRAAEVVLIDLDLAAPSVAIRLGLPARPDITDVADAVRATGVIDARQVHRSGSLDVIAGSHRRDEVPLRASLVDAVLDVSLRAWDEVIVDVGADPASLERVARADDAVLVIEGSAIGVVRAAQLVDKWIGPVPAIVLNRVDQAQAADLAESVERWTGLAPAVVIPERPKVRRAARAASGPDRRFVKALTALGGPR